MFGRRKSRNHSYKASFLKRVESKEGVRKFIGRNKTPSSIVSVLYFLIVCRASKAMNLSSPSKNLLMINEE
jgi:hypothetical protein